MTGEWYPAQMSRGWLLDELEPLIAGKYPGLLPQDASELGRLLGSPMSARGEDEDSLDLDDGNTPAENADVSVADRSTDDIPLAELALL